MTFSSLCFVAAGFSLVMLAIKFFSARIAGLTKDKGRSPWLWPWLVAVILFMLAGWATYTKPDGYTKKTPATVLNSVVSEVAGLADTEKTPSTVLDSVVSEVTGLADKAKTAPSAVLDSVVSGVAGLADTEKTPSAVLDSVVSEVTGLADKGIDKIKESAPVVKDLAESIFDPETPEEIAEPIAQPKPAAEPKPAAQLEPSAYFGMGNENDPFPAIFSAPKAEPVAEPKETKRGLEALAEPLFTTAKVEAARTKLAALLRELEAMRHTPEFQAFGFASNNPTATDWKEQVEAARASFENDESLPAQIRALPAALLSKGLNWQRGKEENNTYNLRDMKEIAAEWQSKP